MSDVFISYARSTEKQAQQVAEALRALGFGVWRDDELPAHKSYAAVIEERLKAAKAVVVIWSAEAATSDWVQSEADTARMERKLVQLTVDGSKLPRPFDRIQCADLIGWTGDLDALGWRKVVASVSELTGALVPAWPHSLPPATKPAEPLLAVLPFDNLSGDADMAYFSDGVSEEIQQTVARGADLKVIGRGSSFQFRGAEKAAAHVASALGATHVLDGSVRRSGPKVRITAELIECAMGVTLWSDRFDRDLSDIFALQDEIAAAVAAALKTTFASTTPAGRIDPAAYDLYLRVKNPPARHSDVTIGMEMLERAARLAPNLALVWAALAYHRAVYIRQPAHDTTISINRQHVIDAAKTALRLDPKSAFAYAALSELEPWGAYGAREALLERSVTSMPRDPEILSLMGGFLSTVGRHEEALRYASQALELNPLSDAATGVHAMALGFTGRYVECQRSYEEARKIWPLDEEFWGAPILYAACHEDWAQFDRLSNAAKDAGAASAFVSRTLAVGEMIRHPSPKRRERVLNAINDQLRLAGTIPFGLLIQAFRMGLVDETFLFVERASFANLFDNTGSPPAADYTPGIVFDRVSNLGMMQDIRFVDFCAKIGLCAYWTQTNRWPDCAGFVAYDFKAEARRLAAA
jgi:TolB-like protein